MLVPLTKGWGWTSTGSVSATSRPGLVACGCACHATPSCHHAYCLPCRQGQGAVLPARGARGGWHSPGLQVSLFAPCGLASWVCVGLSGVGWRRAGTCQSGESVTWRLQVDCATGCGLRPLTRTLHTSQACLQDCQAGRAQYSERGHAGGVRQCRWVQFVGVVGKFEIHRVLSAATAASPARGGQQQDSLPLGSRLEAWPISCGTSAELVNGMVVHPKAREPAHYGPVRSIAAAVSVTLCHPAAIGGRVGGRSRTGSSPLTEPPVGLSVEGPRVDLRRLLRLCILQGVDAAGRAAGQPVDALHR